MEASTAKERIHTLDVIRGAAVFGILLVNMRFFSSSLEVLRWRLSRWPEWWNAAAELFIDVFVAGRFLCIFAFLFGYGMIMMQERAEAAGRPFARIYARRLAALAVFGLIHGLFIWFGDVLFHYAVVGFLLLAFRRAEPGRLLAWAVGLMSLLPMLVLLASLAGGPALPLVPAPDVQARIALDEAVYSGGTYAEIQRLRVRDWIDSAFTHITYYPHLLGLFLLGAYFARAGLLHDVRANRALLVRLAWRVGAAVAAVTAAYAWAPAFSYVAGGPVVGLFYILVLGILMTHPVWERRLRRLAPVGRMAFTNYIAQSVVCTLVFYGYGLGLYGRVGPLAATAGAVALYALQAAASRAWLRRFPAGPLERLWRRVTYGPEAHRKS